MRTATGINGGQTFYYQQDHEDSVTHLTDGSGNEGTVRMHNKSSDGQPDSTGCVTACAPAVDRVTKLMNDNMNAGGTRIIFIDGKQTVDGHEVRRAEAIAPQKYGQ
jgi:hypothetical protein